MRAPVLRRFSARDASWVCRGCRPEVRVHPVVRAAGQRIPAAPSRQSCKGNISVAARNRDGPMAAPEPLRSKSEPRFGRRCASGTPSPERALARPAAHGRGLAGERSRHACTLRRPGHRPDHLRETDRASDADASGSWATLADGTDTSRSDPGGTHPERADARSTASAARPSATYASALTATGTHRRRQRRAMHDATRAALTIEPDRAASTNVTADMSSSTSALRLAQSTILATSRSPLFSRGRRRN